MSQPKVTYSGHPIKELPKTLPYLTESLCPVCKKLVKAKKMVEDGKVFLEKDCVEHGHIKSVVTNDAVSYLSRLKMAHIDHQGVFNPKVKSAKDCPSGCGMCNMHQSETAVAIIELSHDLTLEKILSMLNVASGERPNPAPTVLFVGPEPSKLFYFLEIVAKAKKLGFKNIAVSGDDFSDETFTKKCAEAGLTHVLTSLKGNFARLANLGVKMILHMLYFDGELIKFACDNNLAGVLIDSRVTEDSEISEADWGPISAFFDIGIHPDCAVGGIVKRDKRKIFIAAMCSQTLDDFDVERAKRCPIHLVSHDGKIYPYCFKKMGLIS